MTEPPRRRRRWALPALLLGVVLLVLAAGWFGQRSLIYLPARGDPGPAAAQLPGGRDVSYRTDDGLTLEGWYVPAADGCVTVLVAPGNGGNRAGRVPLAEALTATGAGVLLVDYRGYGANPGRPTERGLALDVRAARSFLVDDGVAPDRLVYLGESLGTAVVTELAVEHAPAALVLRSPFTSMADVGRAVYGVPLGWALRDAYRLVEHLEEVSVPVAVVHGDADSIVPSAQSAEVASLAREAGNQVVETVVAGADHNDPELGAGVALVEALEEVLGSAGSVCGGAAGR